MSKSDLLFLVVVATLPIQLGKIFFLNHSFVLGIPIDYRAATVYFSDIAIICYLTSFLIEYRKKLNQIFKANWKIVLAILIFGIYLLITSYFSSISKPASFSYSLKIIEFSLLFLFASRTLKINRVKKAVVPVVAFSASWQSALLILEFLFQKSLNLWFLGERAFDASTPGIAHSQLFGQQFLRPYGTFPHPNVAAAYLSISLIVLVASWSRQKFSKTKIIILALIILAIALTFSKATLIVLILSVFIKTNVGKNLWSIIALTTVALWAIYNQIVSGQVATIAERLLLIQSALDITLINPLFGIGSNNFILELSRLDLTSLAETRLLQPVHNVFLLILAENGLIGLLLFAFLMFSVIKNINSKLKFTLFLAILVYASIDHFLWTLHQGQLLFFLTLAYIVSYQKK